MTKILTGLGLGIALAFTAPSTAEAQVGNGPVVTGGLVNVTLVDLVDLNDVNILNNVSIAVAANVAAQVCGVQLTVPIGVIARQVFQSGQYTVCEIADQQTGEMRAVQITR